jgi:hypothetical protein
MIMPLIIVLKLTNPPSQFLVSCAVTDSESGNRVLDYRLTGRKWVISWIDPCLSAGGTITAATVMPMHTSSG